MRDNPFKSKAQARLFFAKEARGELPPGTARKWMHETPNYDKLPEHIKKNPQPGLSIQMYYAEGSAYWLLGHLEHFSSFERANKQLNEWSGTSRHQGAVGFAIYIDGQLVYDGSYNLAMFPADLKRQVNLFLQEVDNEDAHILLAALAEQNPKLEHGYIDPDTGAWMSRRRFEEGADVSEMSEAIVEDPVTVDDINAALISGTLGIGTGGLVTQASRTHIDTGEGEPEPERVRHREAIRRQGALRRQTEQREQGTQGTPTGHPRVYGPPRDWLEYTSGRHQAVSDLLGQGREASLRTYQEIRDGIWNDDFIRGYAEVLDGIQRYDDTTHETQEQGTREALPEQDAQYMVDALARNTFGTPQLTDERLNQLSISHDLDLGGYAYERVRPEWVLPLEAAGITNVAEIEADTFGDEVMGSARDFFGINIHSLNLPVILFEPRSGVFGNHDRPWPEYLPGSEDFPGRYKLVQKGYLDEYEHDCICLQSEEENEESECDRCGGEKVLLHEGGSYALYAYVEEDEGIETLNRRFGPHVGLNADWITRAWHVGPSETPNINSGDLYILEIEDRPGDYSLVKITYSEDEGGNDTIEEIFEGPLEDVMRAIDEPYLDEVRRREEEDREDAEARRITEDAEIRRMDEDASFRPVTEETYAQDSSIEVIYKIFDNAGVVIREGTEDEKYIEGFIGLDGWTQRVRKAVNYIKDNIVRYTLDGNELYPHRGFFHTGIKYIATVEDQPGGGMIQYEVKLKNFTPEEEAAIYKHIATNIHVFTVKYTDEHGNTDYHYDRRIQLYNNGIDLVLAVVVLDRGRISFALIDGHGNFIGGEDNIQTPTTDVISNDTLKFLVREKLDGMLIELGMNRDYIDMLGERIPFTDF